MMKRRSDLNSEREQAAAVRRRSVYQFFDGHAPQEKLSQSLFETHFPKRNYADGDVDSGIRQGSSRPCAQPLRRANQPEECTCVQKEHQVPRNSESVISQSFASVIRALPANKPKGRLVPLVGTGETIATAVFLRPKVTVIDSPLRTASKTSENRLLNSPTLIVFTTAE
jgi:hypothetical protein